MDASQRFQRPRSPLHRYSRLVFGIAFRILNDKSEAEEVVQEVFFGVYRKAPLFDPAKGSAKGWLVQNAFSRARDRQSTFVAPGILLWYRY